MIADLEILGATESEKSGEVIELGADFLVASSPRQLSPAHLLQRVVERIDSEPARVRTDAEGHVVSINPAFSGLCGYSFPEIRGRKPGSLLQGPDTEPECVEVIREAVRTGSPCETEMFNYHKDGSRYRVKINIQPLYDEAGNLAGFEATERKLP
ncbi:MAG: PAS domain-containing protein [Terrimicrobiaceae bacterium]|nr:PAS domain-containing protein [Terrimicrobiaceae bacterium]